MNLPCRPTIVLPKMSQEALLARAHALCTAFDAALQDQVQASEARVANTPVRAREGASGTASVPVAVPGPVTSCMGRLRSACDDLADARVAKKGSPGREVRRAARKKLPGRYRKTWGTLETQLGVWHDGGMLAALPEVSREALAEVFGAELTVPDLKVDVAVAWTRGEEKLALMRSKKIESIFASLGGAQLVKNVEAAHAEFSAAFHMSSPASLPAPSGSAAEAQKALQSVMADYVLKVHAMVCPDAPGSDELAAKFLAPLGQAVAAKANARAPKKKPAVTPKREPASGEAPVKPMESPAKPAEQPTEPALRSTGTG